MKCVWSSIGVLLLAASGLAQERLDPARLQQEQVATDLERAAKRLAAGDLAAAEAVLLDLSVRAPTMASVWYQLAMTQRLRTRTADALASARRATALAPDLLAARLLAVECMAELEPANAREPALALLQDPAALALRRDLVPVLLRLEAWPEADAAITELLAESPTDLQLLQWRADGAVASGEPARAIPALRRMLEIEPAQPPVLETLANLQAMLGDQAAAIATFERLLQVNPSNHRARQRLIDFLTAAGADPAAVRAHRDELARRLGASPPAASPPAQSKRQVCNTRM